MDSKRFELVVECRISKLRSVLVSKALEYSRGDRLSNFKQAGSLTNGLPLEVLAGLVVKHEVAFHNFVNDWGDRSIIQSYERWDEKIGDIINYMILLEALIRERRNNATK